MKRNLPILMVAAVAALLAFLFLQTPPPPEPVAALKPLSMPKPKVEPTRVLAPTTAPGTINEDVVEEVLEQLAPEYHLIHCENAGVLENGLYRLGYQTVPEHGSDASHERQTRQFVSPSMNVAGIEAAGHIVQHCRQYE